MTDTLHNMKKIANILCQDDNMRCVEHTTSISNKDGSVSTKVLLRIAQDSGDRFGFTDVAHAMFAGMPVDVMLAGMPVDAIPQQIEKKDETIQQMDGEIGRLRRTIWKSGRTIEDLKCGIEDLKCEIASKDVTIQALEERSERQISKIEDLRKYNNETLKDVGEGALPLVNKLTTANATIGRMTTANYSLVEKLAKKETELEILKQDSEKLEQCSTDLHAQLFKSSETIRQLRENADLENNGLKRDNEPDFTIEKGDTMAIVSEKLNAFMRYCKEV
ncbi:MAG: hypothetical protein GY941_20965 [Planctomycetes bacterium]|nr:hypothetical protein [Planctomycetota bacterium]